MFKFLKKQNKNFFNYYLQKKTDMIEYLPSAYHTSIKGEKNMLPRIIGTNNIIALCHIIDEYEEFERNLQTEIQHKYDCDFVDQLEQITHDEIAIGALQATKFYRQNKEIIDTINQYTTIASFINSNYSFPTFSFPERQYDGKLQFFYQYILKNKENINQILAVLEKLKDLGFKFFAFAEELDFTKVSYYLPILTTVNNEFTYFANPEIIASYRNAVEYKTSNSSYKMDLTIVGKDISKYGTKITLNSLLFNPDTLPQKLDLENTYYHILKLKKEHQAITSTLNTAVSLETSILDLKTQLRSTTRIINNLNDVTNKEQFLVALQNIKQEIEKLKYLNSQYNEILLAQEPLLNPEILAKQKALYLRRREWQDLDIDD